MENTMRAGKRRMLAAASLILIIGLFFAFPASSIAEEANQAQNFDDYVNQQRQKERIAAEKEAEAQAIAQELALAQQQKQIAVGVFSVAFTAAWAVFIIYIKKNVFTPYDVRGMDIFKSGPDAVSEVAAKMTPMEASAIININLFTEYDLLTCLFDMLNKNLLCAQEVETENGKEMRIICPEKTSNLALSNYEDFFVTWFIQKIGQGTYFSIGRMRDYLQLDSQAAQFDIDYDVWNDELLEFAGQLEIMDQTLMLWRKRCDIIGLVSAALGLLVLYFAGGFFSILFFGITYLNYRITKNAERRSETAQIRYELLMDYWDIIKDAIDNKTALENTALWDRYFLFSIPLRLTDALFEADDRHKALYTMMEQELKRAIGYSSALVTEEIEK